MGNCSSCFKVPPPSVANVASTPLEKDPEEIVQQHGIMEMNRLPTTIVESQANGNSKSYTVVVGSDHCGSLKRAFYPRIMSTDMKTREPSESKLNTLFDSYKDPTEDTILLDGIERLCADLQMSPDAFRVLLLAWKLNAEQMCRFSRPEFVNGCRGMGVDSIRAIQSRLPEVETEVARDPVMFKNLYRFTFRFGLDSGQRILPSDTAVCLWRLVFSVREPPILPRWLTFLESNPHVRGIPKDTWNMFLNFAETVGGDLALYDDTEAWPSLFDEYVEYENGLNDERNQNVSKDSRDNMIKHEYE